METSFVCNLQNDDLLASSNMYIQEKEKEKESLEFNEASMNIYVLMFYTTWCYNIFIFLFLFLVKDSIKVKDSGLLWFKV